MQGRGINASLNEEGRRQAEALAERFAREHLDAVYASTLMRAKETATIVARQHAHLRVVLRSDLEEMSWGIHEGATPGAEIEATYDRWRAGDYSFAAPEGESILDVQERGMHAIREIVVREKGRRILVITHGRFLRVVLASMLDGYGLSRMDEFHHANTGVNEVEYDGASFRASLLNCTAHLNGTRVAGLN